MHVFEDLDGLCSGHFLKLNHACIMPSNEVYELNFFSHCNDDENIRKDIEENFYNLNDPIYSFDIKPFSLTDVKDYNKVTNMLRLHLDMHPCCVHISNFCVQHIEPPYYEKIDNVRNLVDSILDQIINSSQRHVVEFHLKCYDYDNVFDSKYYHDENGYIMKTFNKLKECSTVSQVIVSESSYNEAVTTERDRIIIEHKPTIMQG